MKTKLLKKVAILSLGLMGLFLIGNNLYANENRVTTDVVVIACTAKIGRHAVCWSNRPHPIYPNVIENCSWTGLTTDTCAYPGVPGW